MQHIPKNSSDKWSNPKQADLAVREKVRWWRECFGNSRSHDCQPGYTSTVIDPALYRSVCNGN